jgi:hypothetical protein
VSQLLHLCLTCVLLRVQSSPDDIRKWQELLRPGGIWEQDQGNTSGGVAGSLDGRCDEHGRGARTTVASEADKAETSTAPTTEDEGGNLCTASPLPTPDPQAAEAGGARAEDVLHRCLYVGTPWEAEVVADRRNVEEFNEASRTIGRVLSVRVLGRSLLSFLLLVAVSHEV